jgi:dihydroorotase
LQPNLPIIDNQAQVNFVQNKASGSTQLFPIGALTKGSEGRDMAELFDMKNCGAILDYNKSQDNACLKSRYNMYRILTD